FASERNVSIFGRLSKLLDHTNPIIIGGDKSEAIPKSVFQELQSKFPNTGELDRYANARVHAILAGYLDGMKDARERYEHYLNRKTVIRKTDKLDLEVLNKLEIEKYTLIRDIIQDALNNKTNLSEDDWQSLMIPFITLLFPKYIKVLEKVKIFDYYSNPSAKTNRFIDIALVDANGNLDIIEVKKPFDDKILRKTPYRDNYIPTSELSGGIMQAEKYIFHLSKWGVKGEKELTNAYKNSLPAGMCIRISNPKAIIIVGRDQIANGNMTDGQLLDFEIIKRKYANMIDILTYDDLLRRLNNTIEALKG
ncbi:Shedu immune nuclease family protein, partial [Escherichia coli]